METMLSKTNSKCNEANGQSFSSHPAAFLDERKKIQRDIDDCVEKVYHRKINEKNVRKIAKILKSDKNCDERSIADY